MPKFVEDEERHYKVFSIVIVAVAFVAAGLHGAIASPKGHAVAAGVATLFCAAAPFTVGGLIGFLFGIPKTVPPDGTTPDPTGPKRSWQANTSLEQISDWLTKILLGIGLTQLTKIPQQIQDTGEYVAESMGAGGSAAVASAILICFAIGGFLIGFLLTRFDLGEAIDRLDGLKSMEKALLQNPDDRSAVVSYVVAALYTRAPRGFETAIQQASSFLARTREGASDGELWFYLACAYGQQHAHLSANRGSKDDKEKSRKNVLHAVDMAIAANGAFKDRLRLVTEPPPGSVDDDLASLGNDKELRQKLEFQTA